MRVKITRREIPHVQLYIRNPEGAAELLPVFEGEVVELMQPSTGSNQVTALIANGFLVRADDLEPISSAALQAKANDAALSQGRLPTPVEPEPEEAVEPEEAAEIDRRLADPGELIPYSEACKELGLDEPEDTVLDDAHLAALAEAHSAAPPMAKEPPAPSKAKGKRGRPKGSKNRK